MELEVIIAIALIGMLVFVIGLKVWLGKIFKFKMDEGAVLNHLEEAAAELGNDGFHSVEAIASATQLDAEWIKQICDKSSRISRHADKELWTLIKN